MSPRATVSTGAKAELAREVGADAVFIHGARRDLADWVRRETEGRGVDVVLDSIGAKTWGASLASLAPFGQVVAYGNASGPPPALEVESLYEKSLTVTAYWLRTPHPPGVQAQAREALGRALAARRLSVKLGLVVELAEAAQAHARRWARWCCACPESHAAGPGGPRGPRAGSRRPRPGPRKTKSPRRTRRRGLLKKNPAATYSPTRFPAEYHRLWRA
uniref:zinc-binding dehydrogenase n=1 Tax=Myxococcus dinghuensis TaxID=2906761 RepID=UPI00389934FA